jgi:hypothetical protein
MDGREWEMFRKFDGAACGRRCVLELKKAVLGVFKVAFKRFFPPFSPAVYRRIGRRAVVVCGVQGGGAWISG